MVNKQLLELASSKEDEGYALRPEGTASVVRSYIENSFDKKEALSKFFYIGPMFRGERPQKGRLRQFHQIGVEAIGPNATSPFLDAEVIALAMHLLKELGVKEPQLKINSLGSKEDKAIISDLVTRWNLLNIKMIYARIARPVLNAMFFAFWIVKMKDAVRWWRPL